MEGQEKIIEGQDLSDVKTTEDLSPEEKVKLERETKYAKLQSDGEKGAQKLLNEKKQIESRFETTLREVKSIAKDPTRLVELYDENIDLAKLILKQFYDDIDINDYINDFLDEETAQKLKKRTVKVDTSKIKEKAKEEARKEFELEMANEYFDEKISELSDDEKKTIKAEWEEFVDGRHINKEFIKKRLPKFIGNIDKKSGSDKDLDIMKSTAGNKSTGGSKDTKSDTQKDLDKYYKENLSKSRKRR